jgi:hypothetical protein
MDTINIIKLIGAVILGYAIIFFLMWFFRDKKENK